MERPVEPEAPVALLAEGDVLFDRPPPPYPYPAVADSLREAPRNEPSLFPLPEIEAYALDSDGHEVPVQSFLRNYLGWGG